MSDQVQEAYVKRSTENSISTIEFFHPQSNSLPGKILNLLAEEIIQAGQDKNASVIIVDKEKEVGLHASGRNSGVLHAGFYYSPDSLKAKLTRDGNKLLREFCEENSINISMRLRKFIERDLESWRLRKIQKQKNNSQS